MSSAVIRPLTPDLLPNWVAFFDEAFSDNPRWASCYCHFYHADHSARAWEDRSAAENRSASSELIRAARLRGYLAYVGEKPIGWCNANARSSIPSLQKEEALAVDDVDRVGSIVCFVVAPAYRRQGVAGSLLQAACDGFRRQNLDFAEAYPRKTASTDAAHYHGPLAMFLEAGFRVFRETENVVIIRKALAPSGVARGR